jgi:Predicted membrane protein
MLVCMLASAIVAMRSTWRAKGYLIGAALLVMLGMGNVTWFFRVVYDAHLIPGMHYFRIMQIYLAIGTVGLAVLAAFAIDALTSWLLEHPDLRAWKRMTCVGVALFLAAWFMIAFRAGSGAQVWFPVLLVIAALLAMAVFSMAGRAQMIPAAMLVLFVLYCACFPVRHLKFYDAALLTPPTVLDHLPRTGPDSGRFFTVSMAGAYGLVDSRWPGLGRLAQRALASDLGLSNLLRGDSSLDGALALQLYNRDILSQPMKDEVLGISPTTPGSRLIDLLDVRFITSDVKLNTPGFRVAGHDPLGFWVMENTLARPFVQIYTHAAAARSADDSLAMLRQMRVPTLVLQADPKDLPLSPEGGFATSAADAHVKLIQSASSHYVMDVHAPVACWLFLADANYPGWHAKVDGIPARVWTAQVLGKAVHLDAGDHRVVMVFRSASFHIGLVITLLSLLSAMAMLCACGWVQWRCRIPSDS